jgi:DNA-binding NtrC family response regulator
MEPPSRSDRPRVLDGARLLVVEDEFIILLELEAVLLDAGAAAVRLCGTVDQALKLAESAEEPFGAAILDVRVGRADIAPVARALNRRGIPFVFYTGQTENDPVRSEWPDCLIIPKPAAAWAITNAVARLVRSEA